jgi:hypothetical protein
MKHETLENLAGLVAGAAAAVFFTVMFIALSIPTAETVQKFIS